MMAGVHSQQALPRRSNWGQTPISSFERRRVRFLPVSRLAVVLGVSGLAPTLLHAQPEVRPRDGRFWMIGSAAIVAAAIFDERARSFTLDNRSGVARTLADAGDFAGRGRTLISGMAAAWIVARATGHRSASNTMLRIAAGYAVSNAIVGVLKPIAGRHRPDSTNNAWRSRPFSSGGEWHSFPSSHAVHAFSLASGMAIASGHSWASAIGYSAAGVVAWSRLYDDQHWASDVTTSAVIGIAATQTTMSWLAKLGSESNFIFRTPGGARSPRRRDATMLDRIARLTIADPAVGLQPFARIPVHRHRADTLELDAGVIGLHEGQ